MTHADIKEWLDRNNVTNYVIRPDGIVDVYSSVLLCDCEDTELPIQFGKVSGRFNCSRSYLTSLKGIPYFVELGFDCSGTELESLHGIDKRVKHIGGPFQCDAHVTHLLGLLLVDGIESFHIPNMPVHYILQKYRGTGDVLAAQDELIDGGYIEQARF